MQHNYPYVTLITVCAILHEGIIPQVCAISVSVILHCTCIGNTVQLCLIRTPTTCVGNTIWVCNTYVGNTTCVCNTVMSSSFSSNISR